MVTAQSSGQKTIITTARSSGLPVRRRRCFCREVCCPHHLSSREIEPSTPPRYTPARNNSSVFIGCSAGVDPGTAARIAGTDPSRFLSVSPVGRSRRSSRHSRRICIPGLRPPPPAPCMLSSASSVEAHRKPQHLYLSVCPTLSLARTCRRHASTGTIQAPPGGGLASAGTLRFSGARLRHPASGRPRHRPRSVA